MKSLFVLKVSSVEIGCLSQVLSAVSFSYNTVVLPLFMVQAWQNLLWHSFIYMVRFVGLFDLRYNAAHTYTLSRYTSFLLGSDSAADVA